MTRAVTDMCADVIEFVTAMRQRNPMLLGAD
jgi:hypothetical protein